MKKIIALLIIILLFIIVIFFTIKNFSQQKTNSNKLQVTTSFYPYYFFANQIAGNKIDVTNITPPGTEPHDYELTSGDIIAIGSSQLLILNGTVEPWAFKIQGNLKSRDTKILVAETKLFTQTVTDEEGKNSTDPHIWLSPSLAKIQVGTILNGFTQIDPDNETYYTENANKLLSDLDKIDVEYKNGLKNCHKKDIITSHAAFGYLAKDYGLNQITITGVSPDEEPSLKRLGELADFVKKNNIRYIFFETLVSPKLAQTLAKETGAQALELNPIEGLTPEQVTSGNNYLTIMRQNLHNLEVALDCI